MMSHAHIEAGRGIQREQVANNRKDASIISHQTRERRVEANSSCRYRIKVGKSVVTWMPMESGYKQKWCAWIRSRFSRSARRSIRQTRYGQHEGQVPAHRQYKEMSWSRMRHTLRALAVLKASGGTLSRPPLRMSMSSISRLQSSRTWTTGIACFCKAGLESCFTVS